MTKISTSEAVKISTDLDLKSDLFQLFGESSEDHCFDPKPLPIVVLVVVPKFGGITFDRFPPGSQNGWKRQKIDGNLPKIRLAKTAKTNRKSNRNSNLLPRFQTNTMVMAGHGQPWLGMGGQSQPWLPVLGHG